MQRLLVLHNFEKVTAITFIRLYYWLRSMNRKQMTRYAMKIENEYFPLLEY